jgi:Golgi phosphoprotein 3 (GPP34)
MREDSTTRRRDSPEISASQTSLGHKARYTLAEVLLILVSSSYQRKILAINDPVSLSLRALLLIELVLRNSLFVRADRTIGASQSYDLIDPVHDEVYGKISTCKKAYSVDKWLSLLNGEYYSYKKSALHVKNLRKRVGALLVEKKVFRREKSSYLKEIMMLGSRERSDLTKKDPKSEIIADIKSYVTDPWELSQNEEFRMRSIVAVLSFCCIMDDILLTMTLSQAERARKRVSEIIATYKESMGEKSQNERAWGVFSILKSYLKVATWL